VYLLALGKRASFQINRVNQRQIKPVRLEIFRT
jgi:hypothetical protein